MRLTKRDKRKAIEELISMLRNHAHGLSTSELRGTPQFHGIRTLTNRQIIRLLRASGASKEILAGQGKRTFYVWKFKQPSAKLKESTKRAEVARLRPKAVVMQKRRRKEESIRKPCKQ